MITHKVVAYLISLAVGYWVLTLASKEKGGNQRLGQVIGWIIIVVSLVGPLCLAACHMKCQSEPAQCHWMSHCQGDGGSDQGAVPGEAQKK